MTEPFEFPERPFKAPSDDWYKGAEHGEMIGIEKGRKQIIEELENLLHLHQDEND